MADTTINAKDFLPLLGVVIGISGSLISTYFIEWRRTKKEAKHLAQSFLGELKALRKITEERDYLNGIRLAIEHIEKTGKGYLFQVKVRKDYFLVYKENIQRIGMLDEPLPECLATFYTQSNSILEDLESLNDGSYSESHPESLLKCYKSILHLFEDNMLIGEKISKLITDKYS